MEGKDTPIVRELFIEELEEVQGGKPVASGALTTMACCEEIIGPCCEFPIPPIPPL